MELEKPDKGQALEDGEDGLVNPKPLFEILNEEVDKDKGFGCLGMGLNGGSEGEDVVEGVDVNGDFVGKRPNWDLALRMRF